MSRSERLIQLMQLLRALPAPVLARDLAEEMNISQRSIYRDINSLRATGAIIDGEAGFGYTVIEDPALPPMLFSSDEMEALVLGLREVREVADPVLANAAENALSKLKACLPDRMRQQFEHASLHVKRFHARPEITVDITGIRTAMREETAIDINYRDEKANTTKRRVLPLTIVFMDNALVLGTWCLLRNDFRAFRMDRIQKAENTTESFRPRRVPLLRDYFVRMKENALKR